MWLPGIVLLTAIGAAFVAAIVVWVCNNSQSIVSHEVRVVGTYDTWRPVLWNRPGVFSPFGGIATPVTIVSFECITDSKQKKFRMLRGDRAGGKYTWGDSSWGDRPVIGEIGTLKLQGTRFISYAVKEGRYYPIGHMKCDKCAKNFDDNNTKCPYCGHWASTRWTCSTCGYKNFSTNRTCSECGKN